MAVKAAQRVGAQERRQRVPAMPHRHAPTVHPRPPPPRLPIFSPWYCWYSLTRSFMLDSASVNSISSMPWVGRGVGRAGMSEDGAG